MMGGLLGIIAIIAGLAPALGLASSGLEFGAAVAPAIIQQVQSQRCDCSRKVIMRADKNMKQKIVRRCSKK